MGTLLIDKLLQTVCSQKASDLHLDRGQPADVAIAWSHAPAGDEGAGACRHGCLDEEHHAGAVSARAAGGGGNRLRLCVWRHGPVPRGDLQAARQHRPGAAADSQRVPHVRADRPAAGDRAVDPAAARPDPGDRSDRLGQDDEPGLHDQLDQRQPSTGTSSRSKTRSSTFTSTTSR